MPAQIAESGAKCVFVCLRVSCVRDSEGANLFFYSSVMKSLWKGNSRGEQQQDESLRIFFLSHALFRGTQRLFSVKYLFGEANIT